jgi:hypothetical protein
MTLHLGSDFPALVEQTGRFSYKGMRLVQPLGNGKLSHSQHSSIEALGCVPNNNQENIAGPTVRLHNCATSIPREAFGRLKLEHGPFPAQPQPYLLIGHGLTVQRLNVQVD